MDDLKIYECDQGSGDWYQARLGIPTASEFQTLMVKGEAEGGESAGQRTYMLTLLGERLTGMPAMSFGNDHMERGQIMEDEARDAYALVTDAEPHRVGFIRNGNIGCSPDSLIGEDGMLEIKTKVPHHHLAILLSNEVPAEHTAQLQGQLLVSGRQWVDFVSYWPGLPIFIKRVSRDEAYIAELRAAIDRFQSRLEAAAHKIAEHYSLRNPNAC